MAPTEVLAFSSAAASSASVFSSHCSSFAVSVTTSPRPYQPNRVATPSVGWLTKPSRDMDMFAVTFIGRAPW